jgi:excisionase family DNA binding protein
MKKIQWNAPIGENFSIAETAKIMCVSRQAVYVAIKLGRLKSVKVGKRQWISKDSLLEYQKNKYSRQLKEVDGVKLFDGIERFNPRMAAKYMKLPLQQIYYLIRTNRIKYSKHRCAYILGKQEMDEYKKVIEEQLNLKKSTRKLLRRL